MSAGLVVEPTLKSKGCAKAGAPALTEVGYDEKLKGLLAVSAVVDTEALTDGEDLGAGDGLTWCA